jgi:hypothetical protein
MVVDTPRAPAAQAREGSRFVTMQFYQHAASGSRE